MSLGMEKDNFQFAEEFTYVKFYLIRTYIDRDIGTDVKTYRE